MTLQPSGPYDPAQPPQADQSAASSTSNLGAISLVLGYVALSFGVLSTIVFLIGHFTQGQDRLEVFSLDVLTLATTTVNTVGTLSGITAIVLGIIAIVQHRGRPQGRKGIITAVIGAVIPLVTRVVIGVVYVAIVGWALFTGELGG